MYLTKAEERALEGEHGEALALAYRILVATAKVLAADRLIPVAHAHVSGVSLLTIGEAGAEFLAEFAQTARVRIPTTVNPCGIDTTNWARHGVQPDYARNQLRVVEAYRRMGATKSFTCVPYAAFRPPARGAHVSWAESSAAIYGNSVLGLRTNRESGLTALASAITGKTPRAGLHLNAARGPSLMVKVSVKPRTPLDYGLLGYFAGQHSEQTIGFLGLASLGPAEGKALAAALGTSGACGMFTLEKNPRPGIETVDFTRRERQATLEQLGPGEVEEADALVFGCPQLLVGEIAAIARRVRHRRFRAPCLLFCARKVYDRARRAGLLEPIAAAGGQFVCDACADFSPLVGRLGRRIATDTCKAAHYMTRVHHITPILVDTQAALASFLD